MPETTSEHNPKPVGATSGPMGQYYLLEKIAQGGMAEIYKGLAYDLHGIKRTVVIKKIFPQAAASKEFIDMLVAEAKIAVMLSHGNIAQIYDLGKAGDDYFIVMEYVEGRSVSQLIKQCTAHQQLPPVPLVCHIITEIAAGLDYMHRRTDERGRPLHIIHRDVSPQNVLVTYAGTVKIIDFGIAKARTKLETTDVGVLKGKFAYMSPEQAEGNPIDHRSDIFSLGVILYEMLTGQRLFKAKENRETLRNVRKAIVPTPTSVRHDLPPELDPIILKALAKQRDNRYYFAADLRNDLLRLLHQTYPDFRSFELAHFMEQLFRDDRAKSEEPEEGGKTPLLIIDHTQSAIAVPGMGEATGQIANPIEGTGGVPAGHAPSIVAEYLLTMEEPAIPQPAVSPVPVEEEISEASLTPAIAVSIAQRYVARRRWWWALGVGGGLLLGVVGLWLWRLYSTAPLRTLPVASPPPTSTAPPAPTFAQLTVGSEPAGATIFLNDQATPYQTPATFDRLEAGRMYTIGVFLDGYTFWSTQWRAEAGHQDQITVPLTIDYGSLEIMSAPPGARVRIDGTTAGVTPMTRGQLTPGKVVSIELTADGYAPEQRAVLIQPGKVVTIHAELHRAKE